AGAALGEGLDTGLDADLDDDFDGALGGVVVPDVLPEDVVGAVGDALPGGESQRAARLRRCRLVSVA
ncbi:hypothetical protein, partial [Kineococcus glutinatus]|uniref:hypothetical protein n=1 Tax=Kineococcus glutinatus TaxID=1070872 RepID=UPI0031E6D5AE